MKFIRLPFLSIICLYLVAAVMPAAAAKAKPVSPEHKAKVKGTIVSRDGDAITVLDKKTGSTKVVNVSDTTTIERDGFMSDSAMNQKALVPGLTIQAKGITNANGQLDAKKIKFHPDAFAITVAQQQLIMDNKAAAGHAQTTADEGVSSASAAQSSANQAQSTASQGLASAQAANTAASSNAVAVEAVNKRVSDLGDYTTMASTDIYFANGSSKLTAAGKADLDQLISANSNVNGYRVEIAGYTSSPGGLNYNQRLSQRRAAAVAQYLRENAGVQIWRFVTPAGYGETHPASSNDDAKGRALNRRVEVRILVSKGLREDSQVAAARP